MQRGLVHALAWSLATGAAVTLSWFGVHTVMSGTAYDPPRALPISGAGPPRAHRAGHAPHRRLLHAPRAALALAGPRLAHRRRRARRPSPAAARPGRRPEPPPGEVLAAPQPVGQGEELSDARRPGRASSWRPTRRSWSRRRRNRAGRCRCGRTTAWIRVDFSDGGGRRTRTPCSAPGTAIRRPCRSSNRVQPGLSAAGRCRRRRVGRRRGDGLARRVGDDGRAAGEVGERTAVFDPAGVRVARDPPGQLGDRQRQVRGEQDRVAEAAAAQHRRVGGERELGEERRRPWRPGRADGRAAGRRRGWRRTARRASAPGGPR